MPTDKEKIAAQQRSRLAELKPLAEKHGWGKPGTKTLEELACEIDEGESVLNRVEFDGGLCRSVRVLRIIVLSHDQEYQLREAFQLWKDGRWRSRRNMFGSVSEKLRFDENPAAAVNRALFEELGLQDGPSQRFEIMVSKTTKEANSYPGLMCEFEFHDWIVVLDEHQMRDQYVEEDRVKTTFFDWEPATTSVAIEIQPT
jgi:hypothetical protein